MESRRTSVVVLAVPALSVLAAVPWARASGTPEPLGVKMNVRTQTCGATYGEVPPRMVLVPGGTLRMGVSEKKLLELAEDHPDELRILCAMTPEHDVEVPDLLVDQYEVTNLQYKTYLDANNLSPSADLINLNWFVWDAGQKKEGLPPGKEQHPVRGVNGIEAERCAHWMGKRLPTEAEWEYFARSGLKSDQLYVWSGEGWSAWNKQNCANVFNSSQGADGIYPFPVGHWKDDVTPTGIYDLCGNVSEWTSSPFEPYPGWEPLSVTVKGRGSNKQTIRADFNSEKRVIRGGSCYGQATSNNLVVRWGESEKTAMEAVGFRTVMNALPGVDQLHVAQKRELTLLTNELRDRLDFSAEAIGAQLIHYLDTDSDLVRASEYFAFTTTVPNKASVAKLEKDSVENPVPVGAFTTSHAIAKPPLPPGSYGVFFKAKGESEAFKEARKQAEQEGKKNGGEPGEKPAEDKPANGEESAGEGDPELQRELEKIGLVRPRKIATLDIPTDRDILILRNESDDVVAWLDAHHNQEPYSPTCLSYEPGAAPADTKTTAAGSALLDATGPNDLMQLQFTMRASASSRYPRFTLKLEFTPGSFDTVMPK